MDWRRSEYFLAWMRKDLLPLKQRIIAYIYYKYNFWDCYSNNHYINYLKMLKARNPNIGTCICKRYDCQNVYWHSIQKLMNWTNWYQLICLLLSWMYTTHFDTYCRLKTIHTFASYFIIEVYNLSDRLIQCVYISISWRHVFIDPISATVWVDLGSVNVQCWQQPT